MERLADLADLSHHGYDVLKVLGEGSYGKVFEVKKLNDKNDDKTYALKQIYNNKGIKSIREIDIMCRIRHENLTPCLEFKSERIQLKIPFHSSTEKIQNETEKTQIEKKTQTETEKIQKTETESVVYLLMEKAKGDLWDILDDRRYDLAYRLKICKDIAKGLNALHMANYLHLDLKSTNILLYSSGAKIADFGLALYMQNKSKYYPITLTTINYRSINVLNGDNKYEPADDIWSLGLIFLETLSYGKSIFQNYKKADYTVKKVYDTYTEYLSDKNINKTLDLFMGKGKSVANIKNLIKGMLKFKKNERISLDNILKELSAFQDMGTLKMYSPIIEKPLYNVYMYKGFNVLFQLCLTANIKTETYFLAADIYHRSLTDWNLMDTFVDNIRIAKYHAGLAFFISVKMIEPYNITPEQISELCDNAFKPEKLLMAETIYINNLSGMIYIDNLFTNTFAKKTLQYATDLCANLFLYRYIDTDEWKHKYTHEDFNKNINFSEFAKKTKYYELIQDGDEVIDLEFGIEKYIVDMYKKDCTDFKNLSLSNSLQSSLNSSTNNSAYSSLNTD